MTWLKEVKHWHEVLAKLSRIWLPLNGSKVRTLEGCKHGRLCQVGTYQWQTREIQKVAMHDTANQSMRMKAPPLTFFPIIRRPFRCWSCLSMGRWQAHRIVQPQENILVAWWVFISISPSEVLKANNDSLLGIWLLHQISECCNQPAIHVLDVWPCTTYITWHWQQSGET